jgi:hypothetical protein
VKPFRHPIAPLLAAATATEAQITFVDAVHGTSGNIFKTGSTLADISWVSTATFPEITTQITAARFQIQ